MKVVIVLALLVACSAASYIPVKEDSGEARYEVQWSVDDDDSGVKISQSENRDRSLTKGSYKVLLPDGVVQTVIYVVDGDKGYVAEVENSEPAAPAPIQKKY